MGPVPRGKDPARNVLLILQSGGAMAEVVERVARLEERLDGLTTSLIDLKQSVRDLDARMEAGFNGMRSEMHAQFRWVMGGIGGALLAILLAIVANGFLTR